MASVKNRPIVFRNEACTDFARAETQRAMREALRRVAGQLGREYENIVGGQHLRTAEKFHSLDPSHPERVVGVLQQTGAEMAEAALEAAWKAFTSWRQTSMVERAALLERVAARLREGKFEFCAWLVYEVGKNWAEADADVSECIDFAEYYAREALRLETVAPSIQYPGEHDELRYLPLGAGVILAPWNFPLAILGGMTLAAIVCGNTVVLKPSSDAATIAARFMMLLEECGLPDGVVNLVCGAGATLGNALVEHPRTRFISFTGSKDVGLQIHERAAKRRPGQIWIKRTVLEMGGKDAILVAADADFEAALDGVVASAFGFSGQKCSACSRAIVDHRIYDQFVERLQEKVARLTVGAAEENPNLGPVINARARKTILQFAAQGVTAGARLVCGGKAVAGQSGFFVEPTILREVKPQDVVAQQEIFGPVLAVLRCGDFQEGLAVANATEFGLTGSVYTRSEARIELAKREFHVGNLYINRKCTGAMVGAHPFGGFNLSGTDSKAGGPDYLLLWTQTKSIAQKW